ncbi:hypothetical protein K2Z83_20725 [Oscillochloris sp. ZM17-4]|uniref:hypothetical protein n=1 Tax=Oscillochloris sp. ZM17-4 TaxID=2866714 RepID=UPI001C737441|nr:hypothetical protein [Oscillochloris sp. ZM17-4]MBX0330096.1 hypothetical protein [Oscillochloris sp. ZM17-4]
MHNDTNFSGVDSDEVRRQMAAAEAEQATLTAQLEAAEATVDAIKRKIHDASLLIFHAKRALAGRALGDLPTGDISADLDAVAVAIEGGQVLRIDGCAVEIADLEGRIWRITFSEDADAFWADNTGYDRISDDQVGGGEAVVIDAIWDDTWLIEATLNDRPIHIRMPGDPVRVEELRGSNQAKM